MTATIVVCVLAVLLIAAIIIATSLVDKLDAHRAQLIAADERIKWLETELEGAVKRLFRFKRV